MGNILSTRYLSTPNTQLEGTLDGKGPKLMFGASSMQGWRAVQEDAHIVIDDYDSDTSLFGVFDGHGGPEVARYCALYLPDFLRSLNSYQSNRLSECLEEAFLEFDKTLTENQVINELKVLSDREPALKSDCECDPPCYLIPGYDSGCTAVVALFKGNQLVVANAGDSRCVVSRDGRAIDMSVDHKPEDQTERRRICKAGGRVTDEGRIEGNLNLSRAIGDHRYKINKMVSHKDQMITALPDIRTLEIDPKSDDFMVIACDGIWNSMTSQQVIDFVKERIDVAQQMDKLSSICEELFWTCLATVHTEGGVGRDNMTAVIVKFLSNSTLKRNSDENENNSDKNNNDSFEAKDKFVGEEPETKRSRETDDSSIK